MAGAEAEERPRHLAGSWGSQAGTRIIAAGQAVSIMYEETHNWLNKFPALFFTSFNSNSGCGFFAGAGKGGAAALLGF